MEGTTAWISGELIPVLDQIQRERKDETRSHTIRVLLREALEHRGIKIGGEGTQP